MSIGKLFGGAQNARKQEQAIRAGTQQADATLREMFDKQVALQDPFRQAGMSALSGLQTAVNQPVNQFSFDPQQYFASPEYAALQQQAEAGILRNASATGGLRSGGSQVALSAIAPQLLQQGRGNAMDAYSLNQAAQTDQYNKLMGLTGVGQGSTNLITSQAGQLGTNLANNALTRGQAMSDKYGNMQKLQSGFINDVTAGFLRGF